jgi:hypothetical protein
VIALPKKSKDATALCRGGSRSELNSNKRETPRGKRVASENILGRVGSCEREVPRDKPVAFFDF